MTLVAGGVQLDPNLQNIFAGIGTGAYGNIQGNYAKAQGQSNADATANSEMGGDSGGGSQYGTERLGATEGLDIGNLGAGLGTGLGNASYQNALMQRNFGQQEQLTNEVGAAAAPSELQQIFAGVGVGGKSALATAPLWSGGSSSTGQIQDPTGTYSAEPGPLDLGGDPSGYGAYNYYAGSNPEDEYSYIMGGGS